MFGLHNGINFNGPVPAAIPPTPVTYILSPFYSYTPPYYTSSICDGDGQLLFYTDGRTVWNRYNAVIKPYLGRWPWSGYVMPLICPQPGNDSLYYMFGISDHSYANKLQYVTINMKGNFGRGEIVYPQPSTIDNYYGRLLSDASLLLAGTSACNGKDYWIATEKNSALYAYPVTEKGVDSNAVVSNFNSIIPAGYFGTALSNIKFSASGEKLALPLPDEDAIAVFDFDNSTGKFSNPLKLQIGQEYSLEDIEFSPDASKLYYGSSTQTKDEVPAIIHDVYQFDLDKTNTDEILKSKTLVTPHPDREACTRVGCIYIYRTLTLGPDEKIYVSQRYYDFTDLDTYVSAIQFPNKPGFKCLYKNNAVNLKHNYSVISYNYIRSLNYSIEKNGIQVQDTICSNGVANFSLLLNNIDSVKWDFGDYTSGEQNYSSVTSPSHTYKQPGSYLAKAIVFSNCKTDTAEKNVYVSKINNVKIPSKIKDTLLCVGNNEFIADPTTPDATGYMWSNGYIYGAQTLTKDGTYTVTAFNTCSTDSKSFTISHQECPCEVYIPNAFTPNNDKLNDVFKPVFKCSVNDILFQIYNRFGGLIYQTKSLNEAWDGKIKEYPAATGTYIWNLKYRNPNNKNHYQLNGTVLLLK